MKILVTGCAGLVGSEAVRFYARDHHVVGIDNNMRAEFFGPEADTSDNLLRLRAAVEFEFHSVDIRDTESISKLFARYCFDAVIHCAAQPSHDKAREIPILDFTVNAGGALNLLEATRNFAPRGVFVHMSTNKVYGDAPNEVPLVELATRWEYQHEDSDGIDETCRIDQSTHSLFGASKLAADILAQEYSHTYGLKTGVFRGGCITGSAHAGVPLHGFLAYLVRAAKEGIPYTVHGYKGKQVRDNLHARDLVAAFDAFIRNPRAGAVYNIGGGRSNSISVLEALKRLEARGLPVDWCYSDTPRLGDHICYITDLAKFRADYPEWQITYDLDRIFDDLLCA